MIKVSPSLSLVTGVIIAYNIAMLKIIAGGKKNKDWTLAGCAEYEKRLKKPYNVVWEFVDEEKLADKVLALTKDRFVILLDENGEMLKSEDLAQCLENNFNSSCETVFVIGGAFGHFPTGLKERADLILSLSKMVLPHQLCRILLTEQIYRAQEINTGGKYHHA